MNFFQKENLKNVNKFIELCLYNEANKKLEETFAQLKHDCTRNQINLLEGCTRLDQERTNKIYHYFVK